jgi:hypothetical protein
MGWRAPESVGRRAGLETRLRAVLLYLTPLLHQSAGFVRTAATSDSPGFLRCDWVRFAVFWRISTRSLRPRPELPPADAASHARTHGRRRVHGLSCTESSPAEFRPSGAALDNRLLKFNPI